MFKCGGVKLLTFDGGKIKGKVEGDKLLNEQNCSLVVLAPLQTWELL